MKFILICFPCLLVGIMADAQAGVASSFTEDFNGPALRNFYYGSTGVKDDFKWKAGVASTAEKYRKVKADEERIGNGQRRRDATGLRR